MFIEVKTYFYKTPPEGSCLKSVSKTLNLIFNSLYCHRLFKLQQHFCVVFGKYMFGDNIHNSVLLENYYFLIQKLRFLCP